MSRVQLALNVSDIDEAVSFYVKVFGVEPATRQLGYANFVIAEPALKLVLLEAPGKPVRGVELPDEDVRRALESLVA